MNLDKYKQAWKADANQTQVSFDAELLSQKVKQSQTTFRSIIFWRDVREVGLSLAMIPIWIAMGYFLALPWAWYLTVPVLLWIAGFMLVNRWRHPQTPSEPGEPLAFYAKEALAQVEQQIVLLKNVFWWYLLPPSISCMAFFAQVGWESSQGIFGAIVGAGVFAGLGGTFLFYVYRWIYRINQEAVRKHLEPRRDDLQKLIRYMDGESVASDAGEIMDLASMWPELANQDEVDAKVAAWGENWNRIIPSWREVAIIMVPTVAGGLCAWRFPIPAMGKFYYGPVFFQAVVAAVIPFEIAFFWLWYRSYQRHKGEPLSGKRGVRPGAPAVFTIAMILLISVLAVAALIVWVADRKSRISP
ncbi:MAG: hypothetical protein U0894_13760 [Pirellulales bacterium]